MRLFLLRARSGSHSGGDRSASGSRNLALTLCPTCDRFRPSERPADPSNSRLYKGLRRSDVTLPAVLVAELDRNILDLGYFVSRSSVIEVAIRQFFDRGGVRDSAPGDRLPIRIGGRVATLFVKGSMKNQRALQRSASADQTSTNRGSTFASAPIRSENTARISSTPVAERERIA